MPICRENAKVWHAKIPQRPLEGPETRLKADEESFLKLSGRRRGKTAQCRHFNSARSWQRLGGVPSTGHEFLSLLEASRPLSRPPLRTSRRVLIGPESASGERSPDSSGSDGILADLSGIGTKVIHMPPIHCRIPSFHGHRA